MVREAPGIFLTTYTGILCEIVSTQKQVLFDHLKDIGNENLYFLCIIANTMAAAVDPC